MADHVVTPANVLKSNNGTVRNGTAGAAISAGDALYYDTATGTYKLFDANGAGDAKNFAGIALNSAAAGQPIALCEEDPDFTPGFPLDEGDVVIGSATAGKLCPVADAASGHYVTVVGVGKGNNKVVLKKVASGAAKP
jgi:hypothetical protein